LRQRSMVAARMALMTKGRPAKNASIEAFSQDEAAEQLNVSERSVKSARKFLYALMRWAWVQDVPSL